MRKISIHISQGQRPFSFLARCARTNSLSSGERNGKSLNSFVVTQVVTNEGCKARRSVLTNDLQLTTYDASRLSLVVCCWLRTGLVTNQYVSRIRWKADPKKVKDLYAKAY